MNGPNQEDIDAIVAAAKAVVEAVVQSGDVGLPFTHENVEVLAALKAVAPEVWQRERIVLRAAKVKISDLDKAIDRKLGEAAARDSLAGETVTIDWPEEEPWHEPVDIAHVLNELVKLFNRYLVLSEHAAETLALWCAATHALDSFAIFPRLAVLSPTPECGKTTLLSLVESISPRPMLVSSVTAAAVFRVVDKAKPTLLIDEAQSLKDNPDLQIILNSSHRKKSAYVIRVVGDNHEPRRFSTWTAMAVAAVGTLPEMLLSRSLSIYMRRKLATERRELLDDDHPDPHLTTLRRQLMRFAADNLEHLRSVKVRLPPGLQNRRADNWRPLICVAALAGGPWPGRAEAAALTALTTAKHEAPSLSLLLLADMVDIFAAEDREKGIAEAKTERLTTIHILLQLNDMLERPWKRYRRSPDGLSGAQLADLLRPFGIRSKQLWSGGGRESGRVQRGYLRAEVEEAHHRYGEGEVGAARP